MTDEASKPAKRQRRAKPRTGATAATPLYAAMHETNVALCLASGLVAPRLEDNAARDHHLAAGKVILEASGPSAASLRDARGDLSYGVVIVMELDPAFLMPSGHALDPVAIPLAAVRRLVFADDQARLEFEARTSAYADIPAPLVPYEVDAALFSPETDGVARSSPQQISLPGESGQLDLGARLALQDRCAGLLATSLATLSSPEATELLPALCGAGRGLPMVTSPSQIAWELVTKIDPTVEAAAYKPLLDAVIATLIAADASDGFSASTLLRKLSAALGATDDPKAGTPAHRFLKFASDVVGLRRELPEASFADVAGSAVPRGILLFLLNPEPDTLAAVRLRTPGLGPLVYFVAAMLVGVRAGMTRLPASLKSDRQSFLSLPQLVLAWTRGSPSSLTLSSYWDADGTKVSQLSWEGQGLAQARFAPEPAQQALLEIGKELGIKFEHAHSDGQLSARVYQGEHAGILQLRHALMPTFPRIAAIEADLRVPCPAPKRALTPLISTANEQARATGLHCRLVEDTAGRSVIISAFMVAPATVEALREVQSALWSGVPYWVAGNKVEAVPASPGRPDQLDGEILQG